jgi:hypothetical protein
MAKQRELTQQNFDAIRNHLFDRIHKTGEELKNDFPNILRRAIETEAWRHFSDFEGKPFTNLVDWLAYTFPNGASMGEGKNAITYQDAIDLCKEHPEVQSVLRTHAPNSGHGGDRKSQKAKLYQGAVRHLDRHATHAKALLAIRLAQENPEIYKALQNGEYTSLRAAAEAAGLVKRSNDPLPRLKSFWKRASKKDQQKFRKWLNSDEAK